MAAPVLSSVRQRIVLGYSWAAKVEKNDSVVLNSSENITIFLIEHVYAFYLTEARSKPLYPVTGFDSQS